MIKAEKHKARYLALLEHTFIAHPSASFLEELAGYGICLRGCCGIHAGHLRGWLYLERGQFPSVHSSNSALQPADGFIQKSAVSDHTLYEIDLPLENSDHAYRIDVTVAGKHISGSPVTCSPQASARSAVNTFLSTLTVIIPCHQGKKETLSCIGSVLAAQKHNRIHPRILAVWDHGPDKQLFSALTRLTQRHKISLISTPYNMGFLGCVNYALSRVSRGDVLLLNSDTLVHGNWIDRMAHVARLPNAGTVTAMGSDAELLSYPSPCDRGRVTTLREVAVLDQACAALPADMRIREIPVGVGFCMLITHRALRCCFGFDGLMLCRGYGEETDFSLRCRKKGLKNYAACNVYVAHLGGRSFGLAKRALAMQNNIVIFDTHPAYKEEYDRFLLEDPLRNIRDEISRRACAHSGGCLHARPWAEQYAVPEESESTLFVLPQGTQTTVLARFFPAVRLADMLFQLPADEEPLSRLIGSCDFKSLVVHGNRPWTEKIAKMASLAPHAPTASSEAQLKKVSEISKGARLLLAPPIRIRGWQSLCRWAGKNTSCRLYVYHLREIWGEARHPDNISPLPLLNDLRPLQLSAFFFLEKPDDTKVNAWRTWLEAHTAGDLPMGLLALEAI